MVTASRPSSSARAIALSAITSRLSRSCRAAAVFLFAMLTTLPRTCFMHSVHERRTGTLVSSADGCRVPGPIRIGPAPRHRSRRPGRFRPRRSRMTSSTQPRPHATGAARSRLDPALVERLTAGVGTSAEPVTTRAPFTGRPLAHIPQSTSADVERAFTAARAAQREWAELSPRQRARPFTRFHDVLLARQDESSTCSSGRPAKPAATPSTRCWRPPPRPCTRRGRPRACCAPAVGRAPCSPPRSGP
ncbi:aldehyde dehydrogenase family protein [Streptomyces sp. 8ZJF_21]|uniref:aldehyde dehydrogenase family protein n=1 Tax=Streptomyces sp. 8ZJF_21 TaxID=2903141 RepID=UPI0035B1FF67